MEKENCKISQSINRQQVEVLTNFMSEHTDLARGLLKALNAKQLSNNLWQSLTNSLNEKGPPIRTAAEWKKVWADYKYKVKNKLRFIKNSIKKTGGGRYDQKSLDAFELSVVESGGLEAAVDGMKLCKSFGVKSSKEPQAQEVEHEENLNAQYEIIEYVLSPLDEMASEIGAENQTKENNIYEATSSNRSAPHSKSKVKEDKLDLFKQYICAMEEQNKIQRKILDVKRKSYDIKEKQYRLNKKRAQAEEVRESEHLKLRRILIETKIEENRLRQQELENKF